MRHCLLLPAVLLLVAGCAGDAPDRLGPAAPASAPAAAATDRYAATGVVLESPEHGPELCAGGSMQESLPPQCGGVPIAGWDWADVDGEESVDGTTWGGPYSLVGRYDGTTLTLTEPPGPPAPPDIAPADPISAPCPEPDGGWRASDPLRTDEDSLMAAIEVARAHPTHAGVWIDHQTPPRTETDVALAVLNAAFTGDLAAREAELRARWGGPLCMVELPRTLAELLRVQEELTTAAREIGLEPTFSSLDETRGVVEFGVVAITPEQQAALDERYGAGVVEVSTDLQPQPVGER